MNDSTLNLEGRSAVGHGKVKRLRKSGYVPAVVYGQGSESVPVQIKAADFREFLAKNGRNSVFTTEFAAEHDVSLVVKDIQYDVFKNHIYNVDLQRVSLNEKIHVEVPVKITGAEKIEKAGSVIVHQLNQVALACLPQDTPRYVNADVSGMTPGHSLTARDLRLPQGVTLITEPNAVVLAITGGNLDLKVDKVDEPVVPVGEEGNVEAVKADTH